MILKGYFKWYRSVFKKLLHRWDKICYNINSKSIHVYRQNWLHRKIKVSKTFEIAHVGLLSVYFRGNIVFITKRAFNHRVSLSITLHNSNCSWLMKTIVNSLFCFPASEALWDSLRPPMQIATYKYQYIQVCGTWPKLESYPSTQFTKKTTVRTEVRKSLFLNNFLRA